MTELTLPKDALTFQPVTMDEWADLQSLFAEKGPQNGCWCMYWRIPRSEFSSRYGEPLRRDLEQIIQSGRVPGILAYLHERPVGWCSVAPRAEFPVLDRSPTLRRVDNEPVWSIVCFFVSRSYRRAGLCAALIEAAVAFAAGKGASIVEAYPIVPQNARYETYERYRGLVSTFERLGFREVARRSPTRPIVRYTIGDAAA